MDEAVQEGFEGQLVAAIAAIDGPETAQRTEAIAWLCRVVANKSPQECSLPTVRAEAARLLELVRGTAPVDEDVEGAIGRADEWAERVAVESPEDL